MKSIVAISIILALTQCSCTFLRYKFEPALNAIPKDGVITKVTNEYVEYSKQKTNVFQSTNVVTIFYRAYYDIDGNIVETKESAIIVR